MNPQHTLHYNPRFNYSRCSCALWGMVLTQPEEAREAHAEHISKEAADPTPAAIQHRALAYLTRKVQVQSRR